MSPSIVVVHDDITHQHDVDAIVNAANTELWMGSGVAGALKRAGGDTIEREAQQFCPISLGDAITTGAGALPNRCIIHAAVISYRPEDQGLLRSSGALTSSGIIYQAVVSSLMQAEQHRCRTIALPLLGTGVGRLSVNECMHAMLSAIEHYTDQYPSTHIEYIRIVAWSQSDYAVALSVLTKNADKTHTHLP